MRVETVFVLFGALFWNTILSAQGEQLEFNFRIVHALSIQDLLIDDGVNPISSPSLTLSALPFVDLRHTKSLSNSFEFGIGLFAHLTNQGFSIEVPTIDFDSHSMGGSAFSIEQKSYRFRNFRTGLSASGTYHFRSWSVEAGLGPSLGWLSHNHDGTYTNGVHSIFYGQSDLKWASSIQERVTDEWSFFFDWYYSFVVSYAVHPRVDALIGLFGFGRPLVVSREQIKLYHLTTTVDMGSEAGGLIFDHDISVLQPKHFWQFGITINLWDSTPHSIQ